MSSGRSSFRWAPLIASLFLASSFGNLLHLVFVPHQSCVEHGESVHASESHSDEPGVPPEAPKDHGDGHHDHCIVVGAWTRTVLRRDSGVLPDRAPFFTLISFNLGTHASPDSDLAIWRLAPKQSPPARS